MALDPVAVALKFGFLAVLYLFLLWMARSAMKDLRRGAGGAPAAYADDATGMHLASAGLGRTRRRASRSCGWRPRRGCAPAPPTISPEGAVLGRGEQADIQLEDTFASSQHARLVAAGGRHRVGGSGLDERHVPERGAAARPAAAARGRQASASGTLEFTFER